MIRFRIVVVVIVLAGALAAGCSAEAPNPEGQESPSGSIRLPPVSAAPDYQLGGAYELPDGVGVVVRDRSADPAPGAYSICYVNAFQTQPGELEDWPADLVLHDDHGEPVMDPHWPDEALLDTSTEEHRAEIAAIVAPWIGACADAGFDAVEFDNLDSHTRSGGDVTWEGNLSLATRLVSAAHASGLAAGQKNVAEEAEVLRARARFDFAIAEECSAYDECAVYEAAYGEHVIDIEYSDIGHRDIEHSDRGTDFRAACAEGVLPGSVVLRDRDLATPDEAAYVFELC